MLGAGKLALALLEQHQRECADRYRAIQESLTGMAKALEANATEGRSGRKGIYLLLWGVASALIALLMAVLSWFLANAVAWKMPT